MNPFTGSAREWDSLLSDLPGAHLLQTWEWADFKSGLGWKASPFIWERDGKTAAAAMLLERTAPIGGFSARLRVLYAPRGPVLDWGDAQLRKQVITDLQAYARQKHAIFIKIDPEVPIGWGVPGSPEERSSENGLTLKGELTRTGWRFSSEQVQFRNTVSVDLYPDEETIRQRFKQKTRYNINLATRKGVSIRPANLADLPLLYRMYAETSLRDGFTIRGEAYYLSGWQKFMQADPQSSAPYAKGLIAEIQGQPVAAVFLYLFSNKAWYLFGMSRDLHREWMPNHLLQWEAIRLAKACGCLTYDLWGAPDDFKPEDPLWGVFRFKTGLGGEVQRTIGAWDFPVQPFLYKGYTQLLPRLLNILRRQGRTHTRRDLET